MVTIIFEAHGTTFDNEKDLKSDWFDDDLSELGIKQSIELGERYRDDLFDAIFCSDLKRAVSTAELAFHDRGFMIIRDQRLRECNYGDLNRRPGVEVDPVKVLHIEKPFPNGESYEQTAVRMKNFLNNLLINYEGKRVMIIGHRATQYGLEHWILGLPLEEIVPAPWHWQPGWTYQLEKL